MAMIRFEAASASLFLCWVSLLFVGMFATPWI